MRHPKAIHRNQHGIYWRYLGQGLYALAQKSASGGWIYRKVALPDPEAIQSVRPNSFNRWSYHSLPTYAQAISAAEGNRRS